MRAALVSPVNMDGTLTSVSTISHAPTASVITIRSEKYTHKIISVEMFSSQSWFKQKMDKQ